MINNEMRYYQFEKYPTTQNDYGEDAAEFTTTIKSGKLLAIYENTNALADGVIYNTCEYVGLTRDKTIDDKHIFHYGDKRLKVKYTIPKGRLIQLFLTEFK